METTQEIPQEKREQFLRDWNTLSPVLQSALRKKGIEPQQQVEPSFTAPVMPDESLFIPQQPGKSSVPSTKSWYQQTLEGTSEALGLPKLWEQAKKEFDPWSPTNQAISQRFRILGTPTLSPSGIKENIEGTLKRYKPTPKELRTAVDMAGTVATMAIPAAAPWASPYAMEAMPLARRLLSLYGPGILKAVGVGTIDGLATYLANTYLDPEHPQDPVGRGLMTGGLEFLGGALGAQAGKTGGNIAESFRETPHGQTLRTTLEKEGGKVPFPGFTTGNPFLRSSSILSEHGFGGKPMRTAREEAQALIDDALEQHQKLYGQPGRVSAATQRRDPAIPQQSTLDLETQLRPHFPMGDPLDIKEVPQIVKTQVGDQLKAFKTQMDHVYGYLDTAIEQTPIPWHFGRGRLPIFKVEDVLKMPELTQQGSLFHQTENAIKALEALPDHITLNTAREAQGWLRKAIDEVQDHLAKVASGEIKPSTESAALQKDLQYKVLPALGQSMQQLNEWITPLLVDIQPVQREARRFLANYDRFPVPEAAVIRGQSTRVPGAEDPHITTLRQFVEQEPYARFQDAQQYRSKFGEIARQPGQNVGNTTAETGEKMAEMMKVAMTRTADNLGKYSAGGLTQQWRTADSLFREGAQVWNSELITELTGASLDDILNTIVRNSRPNDLKTLRAVLGEDVWHDVGQMWLAQMKEGARDRVTKAVNPGVILEDLKSLTKAAEEELFPLGLRPLRRDLERTAAMEKLLTSTDPLQTRELLRVVGPSAPEVQEIGAVRLSQLAEKHRDAYGHIKSQGMLDELNSLGATERELYGTTLAPLKKTLTQSAAMERAAQVTDPTKLRAERALVDDPELWRAVQSEKLAPAFQVISDPNLPTGQMLDGKHLVDYLNKHRAEFDAVFPDKTMVDHLYHLGQTAQALAQHGGREVPHHISRFQPLVRFTEAGAIITLGFGIGHPLAAGTFLLTMNQFAKAMTNPTLAKWLTTGMRTPINARHVGEVAGALSGALLSEGFAPSTGPSTPTQPAE